MSASELRAFCQSEGEPIRALKIEGEVEGEEQPQPRKGTGASGARHEVFMKCCGAKPGDDAARWMKFIALRNSLSL